MRPTFNPVYRSLNKPLTIWGVERQLVFLAAMTGGAVFNLFGTLLGGIVMFLGLFAAASWATAKDPQMLRILLTSSRLKRHYDPAKHAHRAERANKHG